VNYYFRFFGLFFQTYSGLARYISAIYVDDIYRIYIRYFRYFQNWIFSKFFQHYFITWCKNLTKMRRQTFQVSNTAYYLILKHFYRATHVWASPFLVAPFWSTQLKQKPFNWRHPIQCCKIKISKISDIGNIFENIAIFSIPGVIGAGSPKVNLCELLQGFFQVGCLPIGQTTAPKQRRRSTELCETYRKYNKQTNNSNTTKIRLECFTKNLHNLHHHTHHSFKSLSHARNVQTQNQSTSLQHLNHFSVNYFCMKWIMLSFIYFVSDQWSIVHTMQVR